jgi:hypothetical protein
MERDDTKLHGSHIVQQPEKQPVRRKLEVLQQVATTGIMLRQQHKCD